MILNTLSPHLFHFPGPGFTTFSPVGVFSQCQRVGGKHKMGDAGIFNPLHKIPSARSTKYTSNRFPPATCHSPATEGSLAWMSPVHVEGLSAPRLSSPSAGLFWCQIFLKSHHNFQESSPHSSAPWPFLFGLSTSPTSSRWVSWSTCHQVDQPSSEGRKSSYQPALSKPLLATAVTAWLVLLLLPTYPLLKQKTAPEKERHFPLK